MKTYIEGSEKQGRLEGVCTVEWESFLYVICIQADWGWESSC